MEKGTQLRISMIQLDIVWENKKANLEKVHKHIASHALHTDVFVLPEMFSTGFSMNSHNLAETNEDETVNKLKEWAKTYGVAICGSFIASDSGKYYNRGFFITPDREYFYDKRHLFRMGDEPNHFSQGNKRLILNYKGFNICLLICYDLSFPVWARNINNEYDLLIYTANWPEARANVWNTLLEARAIENMCYVCGVNRIGTDGNNLAYKGDSKIINAKGQIISLIVKEDIETITLSKNELNNFRNKFPVWKDADSFTIEY